jgi:hypothetical protein
MLGGVTVIAGIVAPEAAGRPLTVPLAIALMAIPALALLGAGLAPTAVGSRIDAIAVGVALAIGAPVAAALSTAIAVFFVLVLSDFSELTGPAVGGVVRMGVGSALRVAPLLAAVALLWVVAIRYLDRRALAVSTGSAAPSSLRGPTDEEAAARTRISSPRDEAVESPRDPPTGSSPGDGSADVLRR